ncbi:hypothetical protein [Actinacidiphila oryziradicis]|uniref:Uncharacterized protein n=1 Tax=Actinacidiphila oryziradicis TaxID=2571141 RepID=A0A4U0RPP1_9ACTN|nr:hypothetical protein [Actinacidiphila oryziradicis]TJZ97901.1 hypothetical protein FCI23_48970 [Actinacidiphila oryziradicis]
MPITTTSQPTGSNKHPAGSRPNAPDGAATRRRAVPRALLTHGAALGIGALVTVAAFTIHLPSKDSAVHREAARIAAADAARNKQQVKALTDQTRGLSTKLETMLSEMDRAMPLASGQRPRGASADAVARWQRLTRSAVAAFAHPPSGDTGYNVSRAGFSDAVQALDGAVATYAVAVAAPTQVKAQLVQRAGAERDTGVSIWETAATELDVINIGAGYGHQHVYLSANGRTGVLTPDDSPEGSSAQ